MECREIMERVVKQCSVSLSISKSNILIGINKQEIERIKDGSKKKNVVTLVFLMENYFSKNADFSLSKVLRKFCISI